MRFRVSPARMGELKLSCLQQEKRLQEGNICCVRERKKIILHTEILVWIYSQAH